MTEDEPLDLSALDPERDRVRWAGVVKSTRHRAAQALARRIAPADPLDLVAGWFRPILAAAAVLAVALGATSAAMHRRTPLDAASESRRLAALSGQSIGRGERPTGAQLLVAIRSRRTP